MMSLLKTRRVACLGLGCGISSSSSTKESNEKVVDRRSEVLSVCPSVIRNHRLSGRFRRRDSQSGDSLLTEDPVMRSSSLL